VYITDDYLATGGGATAVLPSSWPTATGYQMVPTLYAADAATAAAAGGFYNQTAFVPQLAVTQMPQVYTVIHTCHVLFSRYTRTRSYSVIIMCALLMSLREIHSELLDRQLCLIYTDVQTNYVQLRQLSALSVDYQLCCLVVSVSFIHLRRNPKRGTGYHSWKQTATRH